MKPVKKTGYQPMWDIISIGTYLDSVFFGIRVEGGKTHMYVFLPYMYGICFREKRGGLGILVLGFGRPPENYTIRRYLTLPWDIR